MKILFVRHGESVDDLENRYGGWADFSLTEKGRHQLEQSAGRITSLDANFEIIYTSPLKRALESASILSQKINIPVEVFPYVKERNSYGLLSGMEKDWVKHRYPDLVEALEQDNYVDGSERYDDLVSRVKTSIDLLTSNSLQAIIVVTHGGYLKCFIQEILGKSLIKKEDGGMILIETNGNIFDVLVEDGIETEE
jgi:broad specificity phosphatase PhoE